MQELLTAVPDVDVLLALEPEELGAKMLFLMRKRTDSMFSAGNLASEATASFQGQSHYPQHRHREIALAISEAMGGLQAQGLLVPSPDINGSNGFLILSRRARRFESQLEFTDFATARLLQRDMLHHSVAAAVWQSFMRGEYATAVFQAMRQVEIAVREAAHCDPGDHGVPMIRRAFGKTGPLTDPDAEEAEREALSNLFAGAVGSYKNPHSHRHVLMESAREAAEIVMMASHLLRVVDARAKAKAARGAV